MKEILTRGSNLISILLGLQQPEEIECGDPLSFGLLVVSKNVPQKTTNPGLESNAENNNQGEVSAVFVVSGPFAIARIHIPSRKIVALHFRFPIIQHIVSAVLRSITPTLTFF